MNEIDQPNEARTGGPSVVESAALAALQGEVRWLRTLLVASLLAVIVMSFSLNHYMFRQVSVLRRELDAGNAALEEYQSKREPLINSFVSGLQDFSRNHPDLNPILERYGISPAARLPSAGSAPPSTLGR